MTDMEQKNAEDAPLFDVLRFFSDRVVSVEIVRTVGDVSVKETVILGTKREVKISGLPEFPAVFNRADYDWYPPIHAERAY